MTSQNHCSEGPRAQILHWAPHLLGPARTIAHPLEKILLTPMPVVLQSQIKG